MKLKPIMGGLVRSSAVGPQGEFAFEDLDAGLYEISVDGSEWVMSDTQDTTLLVDGPPSRLMEIQMVRSASVGGHIVGISAAELVNAQVWAIGAGQRSGKLDAASASFLISQLSPGFWKIEVALQDSALVTSRLVELRPGDELDIELEAGLTFRLSGEVTGGGLPVSASVRLQTSSGRVIKEARTDSSGYFEFSEVGQASFELVTQPVSGSEIKRSVVVDGDVHLSIELESAYLEGRLIAQDPETQLEGGRLSLYPMIETGTPRGSRHVLSFDSRGRFTSPSLSPGAWRLTFERGRGPEASKVVFLEPSAHESVDLEVGAEQDLVLRFESPIPTSGNFYVGLRAGEAIAWQSRGYPLRRDQSLELAGVPQGIWTLQAWSDTGLVSAPTPIEVPSEGAVALSMRFGGSLRVIVPSWAEQGHQGLITVSTPSGALKSTSENGAVQFPSLYPGRWMVEVGFEDETWAEEIVIESGQSQKIVARP